MNVFQLKSRARLLYDSSKYSTVAFVNVPFGSALEEEKYAGAAHFIEHLLFTKTKKYTRKEISFNIERTGSMTNAYTKKESTAYYIKGLPDFFKQNLDILSDCMLNSIFDEKEIETERKIILSEITEIKDNPTRFIFKSFLSDLYYNHPLGFETAGTEKSVSSIKKKDLERYFKKYYSPNSFNIGITSSIPARKIVEELNAVFPKQQNNKQFADMKKFKLSSWKPREKELTKEVEQTHICLGFPFNPNNLNNLSVFNLLSAMLGEGLSSILFQELREKRGLCYDIHSFVDSDKNHAFFCVYLAANPKNQNKAIQLIKQEFEKVKKGKINEKQLDRARAYFKGKQLIAREDPLVMIEQNIFADLYGFQQFEDFVELVSKKSKKEIQEVCKESIPANFTTTILSPKK